MFPVPLFAVALSLFDAPTSELRVRLAVSRALPLLVQGAAGHMEQRTCFACHNQAVPVLALVTARAHRFTIDAADVQKNAKFTRDFLAKNRNNYLEGRGQGGQVATAGYALWTLELGGWQPDETSSAVAEYFLRFQADLNSWRMTSNRPPSETSHFTANYLALRLAGLRHASPAGSHRRAHPPGPRLALANAGARHRGSRFSLVGIAPRGAHPVEVQTAARELLQTQRDDGGWAQTTAMEPDSYATGSALVALHDAAGLPTTDAAYQRGVRYLLNTQLPDGSWYVRSRSKPFQLYYESGFPHGKDQFISVTASAWAVTALALSAERP